MATLPPDLAEGLAFLGAHPCLLVGIDRIQLPAGLASDQVDRARRLRPVLVALLNESAQDAAEERAAILEFDAGFARENAERMAGIHPP